MKMYCLVQDGIIQGFAAFEENEEFDPSIWKLFYPEAKIGDVYNPNQTADPTWNEDVDAMLVDHELRLSMVELGLDPKDESEVKK